MQNANKKVNIQVTLGAVSMSYNYYTCSKVRAIQDWPCINHPMCVVPGSTYHSSLSRLKLIFAQFSKLKQFRSQLMNVALKAIAFTCHFLCM